MGFAILYLSGFGRSKFDVGDEIPLPGTDAGQYYSESILLYSDQKERSTSGGGFGRRHILTGAFRPGDVGFVVFLWAHPDGDRIGMVPISIDRQYQ